jgi:hypothetical protein
VVVPVNPGVSSHLFPVELDEHWWYLFPITEVPVNSSGSLILCVC